RRGRACAKRVSPYCCFTPVGASPRLSMNAADEYSGAETDEQRMPPTAPHRLIDRIIEHFRDRRESESTNKPHRPADDEELVRSVIRQLRRNPIPTVLLGASLGWLLLAKDEADEEDDTIGARIEDEIVGQIQGGFDYTGDR